MLPPRISPNVLTSVKPIPSPPCDCASVRSSWENRSKIRGNISGEIPMPSSRIRMTASSPSMRARSQICPRSGVYLAALFSRLAMIWASRTGSTSNHTGSSGSDSINSCLRAAINARLLSTACSMIAASSMASLRSPIFPWRMRDASRRSSTSRIICAT